MYVAIIKALVDTTGPDITRNNIDMPAGSRHMVSMLDIKYFLAHPDAFLIEDSNYDLSAPLLTQIDSNRNSIANIIPRTGTLASLMTLAGGVGEIASATDVNALVKFNGVAGQAVAFYVARPSAVGAVNLIGLGNYPSAAITGLQSEGVAAINEQAIIDSGWNCVALAGYTKIRVNAYINWQDSSVATANLRRIIVQTESGVGTNSWAQTLKTEMTSTASINNSQYVPGLIIPLPAPGVRVRVALYQESGVTLSPVGSVSFEQLK